MTTQFRRPPKLTQSSYSTVWALTNSWRRRLGEREKHWQGGVQAVASEALDFWKRTTSGTTSEATLAKLGHPFGRGATSAHRQAGGRAQRGSPRGRARIPLLPINRQTGRLHDTLSMVRLRDGEWSVQTRAPHAKYVLAPRGTELMVPRGFMRGSMLPNPGAAGALDRYVASLRRELRRHITGQ